MDIKQLRSRVQYWKRQLGLNEWNIRTRIPNDGEMPQAHAEVLPRGDHGRAFITIHGDTKYPDFWILHELAHVLLHGIAVEEGKAALLLEERTCNRVAKALCAAHRLPCPTDSEITQE